nr:hypothetical protein [Lentilactobacillus sp. Marseille-Q4993]
MQPTLPIYRENQPAGFKEPSFFITRVTTVSRPELFERQNRSYYYQIVYFPDPAKKTNVQLEVMEEFLLDNFLSLADFAYIREREFTESDGALTMTFKVQLRAYPQRETTMLETMKYKGGLAGGSQTTN